MFRSLRLAILAAMAITLMVLPGLISSAHQGSMVSVVVEFREEPGALYAARAEQSGTPVSDDQLQSYRDQLLNGQDAFLAALGSSGISFEAQSLDLKDHDGSIAANVPLRYTLVFNGITLKVPQSSVSALESMPQVKKVHSNSVLFTELNKSVPYIRAPEVYGGVAELTPFDDLREGFEGQGINISIIDTGVDWTHEMFGGDPTPPRLGVAPASASVNTNKKVIYALSLADAVTDGFGHGTHVGSTAAGYLGFAPGADGLPLTADDIRVHGVAPQARILSYKVCSDSLSTVGALTGAIGGCFTSNIVLAIEDSVSPRTLNGLPKPIAHVINMSLGGGGGPNSPTSVASDNASLLGTTVVSSAGNSGPGEGTLGAPAAGTRVIAVAASTDPGSNSGHSADVLAPSSVNPVLPGAIVPASGLTSAANERSQIRLFPMAGAPAPPQGSMAQYYVFVRNGQTLDEWPANVRGRIALVKLSSPRLPSTTFAQVANNAALSGAAAVIFVSSTQTPTAVRTTIPASNISIEDGEYLVDLVSSSDDNNVDPPNGAMSEFPIRINPFFGVVFNGEMAGFSSRGPVQGFGQVKPDVTAPGVNVLAALPPASVLGALAGSNYGPVSGTSMASPHAAGVAALIKQAHPAWNPDMIRTAMINTATNLRDEAGAPKQDGVDSINDQGGGLVDVFEAIHAKALMGVAGDGIAKPSILGSHSYGEVPVVNSRVTHTETVTVTVRDVSGEGGTYNLSVIGNRDLQISGVGVALSSASVAVPANGSATFSVNATVDGNIIRNPTPQIQMQWYVKARRSDGKETLRMPFYLRPVPSVPAATSVDTEIFTGSVLAGDGNNLTVPGVTFVDIPFQVSNQTSRINADLNFFETVDDTIADLDFFLLNPAGAVIGSSTNPGGPENINIPVSQIGTYTYRVTGFLNTPTDFTITSSQIKGESLPPQLLAIEGEFTDSQGRAVDFDGSFTLRWQPRGGEQGFEIERSTDGGSWQVIASLPGSATSHTVSNQANGEHSFRVRALFPGQIGFFVTPPSNVESILVDTRVKEDITNQVSTAISNVSLAGGIFQFDLNLRNQSATTYVPLVELKIVRINSASGTVRVINADNGGDGTSQSNAALFDYSRQLGADEQLSPSEVSGNRSLRFQDNASELFTFDAVVTAFRRTGSRAAGLSGGEEGGGGEPAPSGSPLLPLTTLARFTVNPITGTITVQIVKLML